MVGEGVEERQFFLSTLPAGPRARGLARAVTLTSVATFLLFVPFARVPLGPVWAFIPLYASALVVTDLITAVLLFGQFAILRSLALLVLGGAYLFTAGITVVHGLTFPGLFTPTGLLGAGPQTTAWLYMFWHGGFPLLVAAYALVKDPGSVTAAADRPARVPILVTCAAVVVAVAGLTLLATAGGDALPAIMQGNHYTGAMLGTVGGVWGLSLLALGILWRHRPHTVLDLWLMVVLCAWLADVALSAVLNAGRFDLGFYAGRIYGLGAASFVLLVLLIENGRLYATIARDLTARRQAEEAVSRAGAYNRSLIEASLDPLVTIGPDGKITDVNAATEAVTGYPRARLIGTDFSDYFTAPGAARAGYEQVFRDGTVRDYPLEIRRRDGGVTPVLYNAAVYRDERGQVIGVFAAARDVTTLNQAEAALRRMNETLEARVAVRTAALKTALADKDTLLREVHHRVKNNLQMLCDLLYLQMESMPDRDQHPDLQDAYTRIYAIARLHEQLHQSMQSGQVQVREYLERLVKGFGELYPDVSVTLEAAGAGVVLDMDRAIHVGLIVNELLTNAMKHAFPAGQGGTVRVAVREAGDRIHLEVRDTGCGLPVDFDPERAKSMGLRTVHILARRLEARLSVTRDGGTGFTLTFPAQAELARDPASEDRQRERDIEFRI